MNKNSNIFGETENHKKFIKNKSNKFFQQYSFGIPKYYDFTHCRENANLKEFLDKKIFNENSDFFNKKYKINSFKYYSHSPATFAPDFNSNPIQSIAFPISNNNLKSDNVKGHHKNDETRNKQYLVEKKMIHVNKIMSKNTYSDSFFDDKNLLKEKINAKALNKKVNKKNQNLNNQTPEQIIKARYNHIEAPFINYFDCFNIQNEDDIVSDKNNTNFKVQSQKIFDENISSDISLCLINKYEQEDISKDEKNKSANKIVLQKTINSEVCLNSIDILNKEERKNIDYNIQEIKSKNNILNRNCIDESIENQNKLTRSKLFYKNIIEENKKYFKGANSFRKNDHSETKLNKSNEIGVRMQYAKNLKYCNLRTTHNKPTNNNSHLENKTFNSWSPTSTSENKLFINPKTILGSATGNTYKSSDFSSQNNFFDEINTLNNSTFKARLDSLSKMNVMNTHNESNKKYLLNSQPILYIKDQNFIGTSINSQKINFSNCYSKTIHPIADTSKNSYKNSIIEDEKYQEFTEVKIDENSKIPSDNGQIMTCSHENRQNISINNRDETIKYNVRLDSSIFKNTPNFNLNHPSHFYDLKKQMERERDLNRRINEIMLGHDIPQQKKEFYLLGPLKSLERRHKTNFPNDKLINPPKFYKIDLQFLKTNSTNTLSFEKEFNLKPKKFKNVDPLEIGRNFTENYNFEKYCAAVKLNTLIKFPIILKDSKNFEEILTRNTQAMEFYKQINEKNDLANTPCL